MTNRVVFVGGDGGGAVHLGTAEQAYREWILNHTKLREPTSERRRRLEERDNHGEQQFAIHVWWPVLGSFEYLHPEYEVNSCRLRYHQVLRFTFA